jgi:MFS transporter, PPP family, 3-phenylpropionic acid transporter
MPSFMPNIARITIFLMLVHLGLGAILPYLPVWLGETKGLSGSQIGIILASSSFGRIFIGPLAAAWAEGRSDRRTPLIVFSLSVAIGYLAYPFFGPFWPIALVCFATGVAGQCLVAFAEANTLRATAHSSMWPYGRARAMASAAFAIASLGAGAVVQAYGIGAAYVWFAVATMSTFLWCFVLKREVVELSAVKPIAGRLWDGLKLLARPTFLVGVLAAGFIQAAHAFYYGFSSMLWLAQGFTGTQVGLLWALGVGVEVLFLAFVVNRLNHLSPRTMILIGGIGAIIRWGSMSFGLGLGLTFAVQVFHALTFAITHIGLMRLIEGELTPDQRSTGQQISSSLIMSPLMGIASIGAGWLYDNYKIGGYWSGVGLATIGVVLIGALMVLRARPTQRGLPDRR